MRRTVLHCKESNELSHEILTITTNISGEGEEEHGGGMSQDKEAEHGETLTMVQEEVSNPAFRHTVITTNCNTNTSSYFFSLQNVHLRLVYIDVCRSRRKVKVFHLVQYPRIIYSMPVRTADKT